MICLTVLLVLISGLGADRTRCSRPVPRACPGNTLDRMEFLDYVATGETFLHIYSIEKDPETYGKSYTSFTPTGDGRININNYGFNEVQEKCVLFQLFNQTITKRKEKKKGKCCRKQGRHRLDSFITLDGDIQFRFYSQAPEKYLWNHFCSNGTVRTFDSCNLGFVDLLIRDTRPGMTGEINLSGLPWHLIADDIKFTGIKFGNPRIKYIWRGPPCFLGDFPAPIP